MKKFIQLTSLFCLLVLFGVVANAQSSYGSEVEIPFAFTVGDHSYDAGHYIVKIEKFSAASATLSIREVDSNDSQRILLNGNGDDPASDMKLVFDTIEGRRYLSKVRTPDRSYGIVKSKPAKDASSGGGN